MISASRSRDTSVIQQVTESSDVSGIAKIVRSQPVKERLKTKIKLVMVNDQEQTDQPSKND